MGDLVASALEESERVCKKQRLCSTASTDAVDRIIQGLQKAQLQAGSHPGGLQGALESFSTSLQREDLPGKVAKSVKELHSGVAKLGKALEKAFIQDVTGAYRDVPMDQSVLNEVLASHFFHEGNFEVGDCLLRNAGIPNGDALRSPYQAMHKILEQMRLGNLEPALQWVAENKAQLEASSGETAASLFEFKLHRLQFLDVLNTQGHTAALQYARDNFHRLGSSNLAGMQRLMGCLCFCKRPGRAGPYADLLSPQLWDDAARDFTRHCCGLLGQASESPLLVAASAGAMALPTLLKLAGLLKDHSHELVSGEQLPVELELGQEFVFRSVFSCPVSREQSSHNNPPMLLPCGHVLCKGSIMKIAKTVNRPFKCPYCPLEATANGCKQLTFPAVM